MMEFKTPILFVGFNRPENSKISFDKIRRIKPQKLYVAIDGPRNGYVEEKLCQQVLEITKNVDWKCEAHYLVRDKNVGCGLAVSGAISWVLENEDKVIIIEDDIVADLSFFYYADQLLEKYKDDERIGMISANNYTRCNGIESDYFFTKYGHIWGWATWKRVWDNFNLDLPNLQIDLDNGFNTIKNCNDEEKVYYIKFALNYLKSKSQNKANFWGPQFSIYRLLNNYLSIVPKFNLASNIGLNSSRKKTYIKLNRYYVRSKMNYKLSNHPNSVKIMNEYEIKHHNTIINPTFLYKIYNQTKSIICFNTDLKRINGSK